jgi:RND superfamily putative drug exporter
VNWPVLERTIVERRRAIVVGWIVVASWLAWSGRRVDRVIESSQLPADESEAAWVEAALAREFSNPFATAVVLVARNLPTSPNRDTVERIIADSIMAVPFVTRVTHLASPDSTFASSGTTLWLVGLHPDSARVESAMPRLRASSMELSSDSGLAAGLELAWTGTTALNYDVRLLSARDVSKAERRVLPVTLLLLVLIFGSVTASLIPIVVGVVAVVSSLGAAAILSAFVPLTVLLRSVVAMLGLGLGIDYSLLMVSRFREHLRSGLASGPAATEALRQAGTTIVVSGTTVMVGLAALLLVPALELRSIAVGGLLVTSLSMLLATTLVPGLLAIIGQRIEPARVRRRLPGEGTIARPGWERFGRFVVAHPVVVLVMGLAPVIALAWQARRARTDLPSGNWLPPSMESARATDDVIRSGLAGEVQALQVVVVLPAGVPATSDAGWTAVDRIGERLQADARVTLVRSLPTVSGARTPSVTLLSMLPRLRGVYMSGDERLALIEIVPASDASPTSLISLVRDVRHMNAAAIGGVAGTTLRVGGIPAMNADYAEAVGGSVRAVVALVVVGTLGALLLAFRAVLVPLKAVVLNMLSVAAAFGAAVLVFQDGHGARFVGLDAPIDGLFPAVPVLVFCLVYGLSMDYEVFLIARVSEAFRKGKSNDDAIVEGLSRTGGIISSAAAVMVTVFAGFALGDFLIVKLLGFTLAVAVLLDATLVRLAIGPALLRLAGRWNWWPGGHSTAPSQRTGD